MKRFCPMCDTVSEKFNPMGVIPREDAKCPKCKSLERHRLAWLYITKHTSFLKDNKQKLLHIAPEKIFQQLFQNHLHDNYLSADLYNHNTMMQFDITDIPLGSNTFDYIYCSHVLEHVIDDKKAMREFHRVLKPKGWAILLVPILREDKTYEDFTITSPEGRLKAFGQEDHVRIYGPDYKDRLEESGFNVKVIYPQDFLTEQEIEYMGITQASGEIYFCTK